MPPMKVLFLAPQPFFQERGTPIAVKLAMEVLSERFANQAESRVDLLTYHEGSNIEIPGIFLQRISGCNFIKGVGPGISLKKLICDFAFFFLAIKMAFRNRHNQYDIVHAVEESVFVALMLKIIFGIPYIYDMDSSIALQLSEKWWLLRPLAPLFSFFERIAVRFSDAVVPVCDALAEIAIRHGSKDTHILRDISLMDVSGLKQKIDLRSEILAYSQDLILLYVGNLESYQGVELLAESFSKAAEDKPQARLVIIGGSEVHVRELKALASQLRNSERIHILGPRSVADLGAYLLQADILASPRTKGNNTPMKIYSYLHSGKAIVATNLSTHTQVLNKTVSILCEPTVESFADGILKIISNHDLRSQLGKAAFQLAEENYTFAVFKRRLNELYDRISKKLCQPLLKAL